MPKLHSFWRKIRSATTSVHTIRSRRTVGVDFRRPQLEQLERKHLLSADLVLTGFAANGHDLVAYYDVLAEDSDPFDLAIYRSADGVHPDSQIATVRVDREEDLAAGAGHQQTLHADIADTLEDYFLLAIADAAHEVLESDESNNRLLFGGGIFQSADGTVHIHGTSAGDMVSLTRANDELDVTFNGASHQFWENTVSGVHARMHEGDDWLAVDSDLPHGIWAFGGGGYDTLYGGYGGDYLSGGDGNDMLQGSDGTDWLDGGSGDDTLYGGYGDDSLYGQDGADTLLGDDGSDTIYGGYGDDYLDGGAGNDSLRGDDGSDTVYGGYGDDYLEAGYAYGYGGDYLSGGDGNDMLQGSDGTDWLDGGSGDDTLYGGYGDDSLYGQDGADTLLGDDGSDMIYGGYGDDYLDGGAGNDSLRGDDGSDTVYGGYGDDYLEAGYAYGYGGDYLSGGDGNDMLQGSEGTDWLDGGSGDDTLYGGYGDDSLYGQDGADTLLGDDGIDTLFGGYGDDYLDGGAGDDNLDGGGEVGDVVADRPTVVDFTGQRVGQHLWRFTGRVVDDTNPTGLTVAFGGVIPDTETVTVYQDGTFLIEIISAEEIVGWATAFVTDAEGLASTVALCYVT